MNDTKANTLTYEFYEGFQRVDAWMDLMSVSPARLMRSCPRRRSGIQTSVSRRGLESGRRRRAHCEASRHSTGSRRALRLDDVTVPFAQRASDDIVQISSRYEVACRIEGRHDEARCNSATTSVSRAETSWRAVKRAQSTAAKVSLTRQP